MGTESRWYPMIVKSIRGALWDNDDSDSDNVFR